MQYHSLSLPARLLRRLLARRRGMALLLVMIGMVVCTILTAGFLATQGTAIGIARNERDAVKCHGIAQTGIDMCYWLIKNKSDWRTTMAPGNWLSNAAIGDGTVSVNVSDSTGTFADDPVQPVTISSTGTYDNRSFTLTATIRPTGGGTVFRNGNFIYGNISLGNSSNASIFDSYNSNVAPYNSSSPGNNASFVTNAVANNSLTITAPSIFSGSYTAGPGGIMGNIIKRVGTPTGPAATATASEIRNAGTVVFPNLTGLNYQGFVNNTSFMSTSQVNLPGTYDYFTATAGTISINSKGPFHVSNNVAIGGLASSTLLINNNVSAVIIVDKNLTVSTNGKILLGTNSQLAIYVQGNVNVTSGTINATGGASNVILYGGSNGGNIQFTGTISNMCGAIYAPQHDMTMQTGSPKLYGAVVTKSLTLKDSSALHFDEALRSLKIDNITGGSAAPGSADYLVNIIGGPGIQH